MDAESVYFNAHSFGWDGSYPTVMLYAGTTRVSCDLGIIKSVEDPEGYLWQIIENERCTSAMLNPKVLFELGKRTIENVWRLHTVWTGGILIPSGCASVTPIFAKQFNNGYGCTELGNISNICVEDSSQFNSFNVGHPLDGVEMKIADDQGNVVPINTYGEVYARKSLGFLGYFNNPEATKRKISNTGWYKTDDYGYMTDTGNYVITGRNSDMIKVANNLYDELISPSVVEAHIQGVPGIEDVCVVPYTNEDTFTEICACIVVKKGFNIGSEDIKRALESKTVDEEIDNPMFPQRYLFFDKIQKDSNGKISRTEMIEKAKASFGAKNMDS